MVLLLAALLGVFVPSAPSEVVPDRAALREALALRRATNLARLHDYRLAKVYPENTFQPGLQHVWIDASGRRCAVATLIERDGAAALVQRIGETDNFIRTATVTAGPVHDWILGSGFTQEEIVMIQFPSQMPVLLPERPRDTPVAARTRETTRLANGYKALEQVLVSERVVQAGLDVAVERLLQRPDLARALLAR